MILFRYLLNEILPQFVSVLIILSIIIIVSQLARLSEVLFAFQLNAENLLLPMLFILLPFFSFLIPMSYFASLILAFNRLSADGEYSAMLASGYSLGRALKPTLIIGVVLAVCTGFASCFLEPWGRIQIDSFFHEKAQEELDNLVRFKLQPGVFLEDFLGFVLYAEEVSPDRTSFRNVMLAPGPKMDQSFTLFAPIGSLSGAVETNDLKMRFEYGVTYANNASSAKISSIKFSKFDLDLVKLFKDRLFSTTDFSEDFRTYYPVKLYRYLRDLESKKETGTSAYIRARYLLHYRLAMPVSIFIFAIFGIAFGVYDPRQGKGLKFIQAITIMAICYLVLMLSKTMAESGKVNAIAAVWLPDLLLLLSAFFCLYQRNRLPLSENIFSPTNFPWHFKMKKPH